MTLNQSAALLLTVLYRRVRAEIIEKERKDIEKEKKWEKEQSLIERGEGNGKDEEDEEAELMITVLMRKVVKQLALKELKRIKKKAESEEENDEDSEDDDEAEVEQSEAWPEFDSTGVFEAEKQAHWAYMSFLHVRGTKESAV